MIEIVRFQFFADTWSGEHDFHVFPVQLFQYLGVSQHRGNDRCDKTHVIRGVFADIFDHDRAGRGDVNTVFGFFEEFFRAIRDDFRAQCRFRYTCKSESFDGSYQHAGMNSLEFTDVRGS